MKQLNTLICLLISICAFSQERTMKERAMDHYNRVYELDSTDRNYIGSTRNFAKLDSFLIYETYEVRGNYEFDSDNKRWIVGVTSDTTISIAGFEDYYENHQLVSPDPSNMNEKEIIDFTKQYAYLKFNIHELKDFSVEIDRLIKIDEEVKVKFTVHLTDTISYRKKKREKIDHYYLWLTKGEILMHVWFKGETVISLIKAVEKPLTWDYSE